tara:strand:- start:6183 stop:6467 length:285 start_codon:yes stop_codon:yes gene_type:complete
MVDLYKQIGNERIKLTDDEVAEYNALQKEWADGATERKKQKLRNKRKELLLEADWQIDRIEDAGGNSSSWRTYRQTLRDITNDPDNPTWPTKPN